MNLTKPSDTTDVYWLFSKREKREIGKYVQHTIRSGKWLIFCPFTTIDKTWNIIREATINGKLGEVSKVSTRRPNPNSRNPDIGVICVYTYDSDDMDDLMEIRVSLRNLGFTQKLVYKTDQATREGKYGKGVTIYSS